jgi:hypothetical protein
MKDSYLILLVGLGAATFLATRSSGTTSTPGKSTGGAQEIKVDGDTFGWRYFTDGTAIDPYGAYYKNGLMVWNPTM